MSLAPNPYSVNALPFTYAGVFDPADPSIYHADRQWPGGEHTFIIGVAPGQVIRLALTASPSSRPLVAIYGLTPDYVWYDNWTPEAPDFGSHDWTVPAGVTVARIGFTIDWPVPGFEWNTPWPYEITISLGPGGPRCRYRAI